MPQKMCSQNKQLLSLWKSLGQCIIYHHKFFKYSKKINTVTPLKRKCHTNLNIAIRQTHLSLSSFARTVTRSKEYWRFFLNKWKGTYRLLIGLWIAGEIGWFMGNVFINNRQQKKRKCPPTTESQIALYLALLRQTNKGWWVALRPPASIYLGVFNLI